MSGFDIGAASARLMPAQDVVSPRGGGSCHRGATTPFPQVFIENGMDGGDKPTHDFR
jgi:hypothetical protein